MLFFYPNPTSSKVLTCTTCFEARETANRCDQTSSKVLWALAQCQTFRSCWV